MKKTCSALLLAVIAVAAVVLPAEALARVTSLKVSPTDDASQATARLGADTEMVYVHFDYEGASNEKLTVSLQGLGLSSILAETGTYSGQGSAIVDLSGAQVYRSLVSQLSSYAIQAQSDVKRATDQELGRRGYLEQVQTQVAMVDRMLLVLEQMDLPEAAVAGAAAVRSALEDLADLAEDAVAPTLDDAGRKAKAEEMKPPVEALVRSADLLADTGPGVDAMAFPLTGENAPFTVQVQVGGNPSASVEFWVVENPQRAISDLDPTRDVSGTGARDTSASRPTARPVATSATGATVGASANRDRPGGNPTSASAPRSGVLPTMPSRAMPTAAPEGALPPGGFGGEEGGVLPSAPDPSSSMPNLASSSDADGSQAGAMPTWTVPANAMAAAAGQESPLVQPLGSTTDRGGGSGGRGGPNLALLALGAAVFVGLAFWLRQRM